MPVAPGTRLGRYEVRSQIGAGGMGEVYLARDTTELGREVAVKVLPPELAADPERMSRFLQEAKTASSLNHPNIITVHEIGQEDGTRYLVTEYVEGETLRRRMTRERLTLREALDVAIQVASALVAAHKAGVVHRDIKPENVMLREDGIVKVLDFGLAKPTGRPTGQPSADSEAATRALVNTSPGMVMGTVSYMSPEQARALPVDERTDIWSLGVVLYEMVTGRVPFPGDTASDVLAHVLTKEPAALSVTSGRAGERLDEIVQKALAKDREERYQHVKDLLIDLKRLKQRFDVEAEIERTQTPEEGAATTGSGRATAETAGAPAARTADLSAPHQTSSAEYIVTEVKRHRRGALLALAAVAVAAVAVAYFAYSRYSAGGGEGVRSVAVLPFQNAGGDPDMEYLSDGVSESLINSLSQLPNVKVMASSTMLSFKGKALSPQAVGRQLGVDAVLTGRVIQAGDNLSVQAELVNVEDGTQMWGERYSRKMADVLAVQDDIVRDVSQKMRVRLSGEAEQRLRKDYKADAEAYQLYLRGRYEWNKFTGDGVQKSIEYYNQSLAKDPAYAPAYVGLAHAYSVLGNTSMPPREAFPRMRACAEKALELNGALGSAHAVMGLYRTWTFYAGEWAQAEGDFKRAIELDPNDAQAHSLYGYYLSALGRHDEAKAEMKRALELDPLSPIINVSVSLGFYYAGQHDEALAQARKTLELYPDFGGAYLRLGEAYEQKGMYQEAVAVLRQRMTMIDGQPGLALISSLGHAYASAGQRAEAQKMLDELQGMSKTRYVSAYHVGLIYTGLGDKEQAFYWLGKAADEGFHQLIWLKVEPRFAPLRSDPRFQELVRRIGLPQ